ncbi:MAG: hypothetical protein KC478_00245 [Bacteriovoracaceae bacterium]|nr:hypothetical protein [Bacteriovoracaceae bacterium]
MKKILLFTLFFTFASCEDIASNRQVASLSDDVTGTVGGGTGNGAVPGDGSLDSEAELVEAKVEIRHLIEPKVDDSSDGGTYQRKLTLPKNYDGHLYLAGINVSTLSDKNLKVRFKFGLDASPIDIPATISTAPGLTPQTNVEVLVMDMRSAPFDRVRLVYDLFDYNDYDFGNSTPDSGVLNEPVQFNRDDKLYCRGLKLEHDPTFTGKVADGCSGANDTCKFAYAKILDKGLVKSDWLTPILPTEINVAATTNLMDDDSNDINLDRCLPNNPSTTTHTIGSTSFPFSASYNSSDSKWEIASNSLKELFEGSTSLGSYYYQGPYQAINLNSWQIADSALLGESGIFERFLNLNSVAGVDSTEIQFGAQAKLFPLEIKRTLSKNVEYMGSSIPGDPKTLKVMGSNGETQWMDGCNERVSSMVNDYNGEHVGSCNVTAQVEIISVADDGTENVVDTTTEVKLQLVKGENLNTDGDNVLLSSFQSCSSTSQCGADECCMNKRCWSKDIVSQCVEDLPTYGNALPGDSCQSDHECSSLCCNQASGKCAVHDSLSDPQVFCSKPSGQTCIAKEWCMKHPVTQCYIVNTGFDAQGQKTCAKRCYTYEEHGDCKAGSNNVIGTCQPPQQPEQPVFNPEDPNRCDDAIDPQDVPVNN